MEFEEFNAIYEKFVSKELPKLKYPDISAYEYFKDAGHSAFDDVIAFLRYEEVPSADLLGGFDYAKLHLYEKKNTGSIKNQESDYKEEEYKSFIGNSYEYNERLWDRLRTIYNRNISEAELLKNKYLQTLNDSLYAEYFSLANWLIDGLFDTGIGKKFYRKESETFIQVVITLLSGSYRELNFIKNNREGFHVLRNPQLVEYLDKGSGLHGDESFFKRIEFLIELLLRIREYESIVYTFYQFESIALHEAVSEIPPVKIPKFKKQREIEPANNPRDAGRNYDKSAPQEPIVNKVHELANKKRFQREDGTPKPTPIRDEIAENYPELMGDIKERALFERVKSAINIFDVDTNGNYSKPPF